MNSYELTLPMPATSNVTGFDQIELSRLANQSGYDAVMVPETWGREAFTRLGYIAAKTDSIRIGTGIIPIHSRSPALIGQALATLDELSRGRAFLGIGLSSPDVIESWHGVEFQPALRRQRETIEIIRRVLSGESVEYDGRVFDLECFNLRFDPERADIPIYVAAQGETNVELTGGFADGWMPNRIPLSSLPSVREYVDRGARKQDRDPMEVATLPFVTTLVLDDDEHARHRGREIIAFYVGAMGDFHFHAVADHGYEETATKVRDEWQSGAHDAACAAVSDALLDDIAIVGDPDRAADLLVDYEDVADVLVTLPPTTATVDEIAESIGHVTRIRGRN